MNNINENCINMADLMHEPFAAPDTSDRFRHSRTFKVNNWSDLDEIPMLPDRLTVGEFKDFGMNVLRHVNRQKTTEPWIPGGWYRVYGPTGRLYLLQVTGTVRGAQVSVWMFRPIFRVQKGARAMSDEPGLFEGAAK